MTQRGCTFIILFALLIACSDTARKSGNPPNIILIMTDDQGWGDLGFHGNDLIRTPRLDRLAESSTRFTQFYVSPVCAPTRASLMTGRYSLRTGVYDTYNGGAIMSGQEMTIAEHLKLAGYVTGMAGKWHLGDNYPSRAVDQGFDYSLVHNAGGMRQVGDHKSWEKKDSAYWDAWYTENGTSVQKLGYCSDVFTQSAIEFINENKNSAPFFFYLSFNAPHTPLQVPEEYLDLYKNIKFDSIQNELNREERKIIDEWEIEAARKVYAMISNIDENVGKVLDHLAKLDVADNTIVIFMTDNGPQQKRYSGSLRGLKTTVYENGIRVPFFIHHPRIIPENRDIDIPVAHIDVLPTLLELSGQKTPDNIDGESLWPLISDKVNSIEELEKRSLFFHWQRGFPEPYRNIAVRNGNFKFIGQTGYQSSLNEFELYNLNEDPGEEYNLVREEQAIAADLKVSFDNWLNEIMSDPGLGKSTIIIGNEAQLVTILNRNDAKGSLGIWSQEEIYGYWDTFIEKEGNYNINVVFQRAITEPGELILRVGTVQRTIKNNSKSGDFMFENVPLVKGKALIDATYVEKRNRSRQIMPFYLEISKAVD